MDERGILTKIEENKRLICSIINKYTKYYEFDDLYQVGVMGIIKADKNYNSNFEVKFSTYAYKYILSEVINYVNNSKFIKTSREYNKIYKKILETRNILTQKLMKEPTLEELACFLEIPVNVIDEVMRYNESVKSLDEVLLEDDKKLTLLDKIQVSNDINLDVICLKEELGLLTKEEQELINLRYFECLTQAEIAEIFGTNQVQVSRNEKKVLKKLKNNLCKPL